MKDTLCYDVRPFGVQLGKTVRLIINNGQDRQLAVRLILNKTKVLHSTRNERLKIVCRPKLTIWPKKIMLTRHRRLVRILIAEARTGFCKIMGHCFGRIQNLIHYPVMTHFLVQCAYLVLTFALCMGIALVWLQEELIKTHNFAFSRAALYKKTQRYVHKIL